MGRGTGRGIVSMGGAGIIRPLRTPHACEKETTRARRTRPLPQRSRCDASP
jgi:hypothetical protein